MNKAEQVLKRQNAQAAIRAKQNAAAEADNFAELSATAAKMRKAATEAAELAEQWEGAAGVASSRYQAAISAQQAWEQVEAGQSCS